MKKYIIPVIALLLLGTAALAGCSAVKNRAGSADLGSVDQAKVSAKQNTVYLMAGKIEAAENVELQSKITAKVTEVNADIGSFVKEGEAVIRLDSKDLEAQVTQARAGVEAAKANLNKLQSGARPEQITQAEAALTSAKANFDNAQSMYQKNQQLLAAGAIAQDQLDQSSLSLTSARSAYQSAQAALDLLNKGETSETIEIAQAQLQQAQAALALAETQLVNGTITAPISGVVSAKNIQTGEIAVAGAPLITVFNSQALIVKAYVPADFLFGIKVGQEVVIKAPEIPGKEFSGQIAYIDSVLDSQSHNVMVKAKFSNQDSQLKAGMVAEIGLRN